MKLGDLLIPLLTENQNKRLRQQTRWETDVISIIWCLLSPNHFMPTMTNLFQQFCTQQNHLTIQLQVINNSSKEICVSGCLVFVRYLFSDFFLCDTQAMPKTNFKINTTYKSWKKNKMYNTAIDHETPVKMLSSECRGFGGC